MLQYNYYCNVNTSLDFSLRDTVMGRGSRNYIKYDMENSVSCCLSLLLFINPSFIIFSFSSYIFMVFIKVFTNKTIKIHAVYVHLKFIFNYKKQRVILCMCNVYRYIHRCLWHGCGNTRNANVKCQHMCNAYIGIGTYINKAHIAIA
jgi:hypothetical protein